MKILALEFSSPQRSVAVLNPETGSIAEVTDSASGRSIKPFALIESALRRVELEREQIECVVVGLGPGSYTGIRAAIALAQGWQLAQGVKLCGISSAECLAIQEAGASSTGKFNVVIDAQRGEFYFAPYGIVAGKPRPISPLHIVSSKLVAECERAGETMIGPEVTKWFPTGRRMFPLAATLAQMAPERIGFASGKGIEPIYLRETAFVKAASSIGARI